MSYRIRNWGEILAAVVTTHNYHDGEVLNDLLQAIDELIEQVSADGTYDHCHCYDEIAPKGAKAVIPPRKDAVIWQHGIGLRPAKGVGKGKLHQRDENLRSIRKHGRKRWQRDSGYHRRSIAEITAIAQILYFDFKSKNDSSTQNLRRY